MRFTNLERMKARGLGTGCPGPCLWVHFCLGPGLWLVRCGREAWACECGIFHSYGKPPQQGAEPSAEHGTVSLLLGFGRRCHLCAPVPSHCHSQKRGRGCSGLWTPAGFPSHWAKRSLDIPVPPRIQIYTVPERRRDKGEETRERWRGRGKGIRFEICILEKKIFIYIHSKSQLKIIHIWTSFCVPLDAYST